MKNYAEIQKKGIRMPDRGEITTNIILEKNNYIGYNSNRVKKPWIRLTGRDKKRTGNALSDIS